MIGQSDDGRKKKGQGTNVYDTREKSYNATAPPKKETRYITHWTDTVDSKGESLNKDKYNYVQGEEPAMPKKKSGGMYKAGGVIDSVMKKYKKKK